jgi:trehalose 6-phosphate phosphatase
VPDQGDNVDRGMATDTTRPRRPRAGAAPSNPSDAAVAADLLAPLVAQPRRSGVLVDFDGTLSPIVTNPETARPLEGAAEVLLELARRYRVVAVLSGRPVSFLEPLIPASVVLSGLYGLEVVRDGERLDHPWAGAWREVVEDVAAQSRARGPEGMRVESKGLSLTFHFRENPGVEADVEAWAVQQAARSGLRMRQARMSVELHPPIDADKGTAVEELVSKLAAVCYLGDDIGDLPAFDALDRLAARGLHTVKVAVGSAESPPALVSAADIVVDGPAGALDLLRGLAP